MKDNAPGDTPRFCFPIDLKRLEDDRLRLVPIRDDLDKYGEQFVSATRDHPEAFTHMVHGPFPDLKSFIDWWTPFLHMPDAELFAIVLKKGVVKRKDPSSDSMTEVEVEDGQFAGLIGTICCDVRNSKAEFGPIVIIPPFQRTFVGTTANCLLLRHCLNPPPADLGLRRVTWEANADNKASLAAAQRLGFRLEGIKRWDRSLSPGKKGVNVERMPMTNKAGATLREGRHSAVLSMCWDDWEDGGREHVDKLMAKYQ